MPATHTRKETSSRYVEFHFTEKHKVRGATILQQRHHFNVPLKFLLEILYYLPISLSNSFPRYVFSFHQLYFCPFPVWFPFAVGQPDIPWVLRFSRVSMMLTCWFVSNTLPPSVSPITRCPGNSSTPSHSRRYSQRRNLHPSAAISHMSEPS